MRLLLDTHTLLWFYLGDLRLSAQARQTIEDSGNDKLVSPASFWEIAIKISINKYALKAPYETFVQEAILDNDFLILPTEPRHKSVLIGLPQHHKEPFDRLLIAQAIVEGIPVVSIDSKFDAYPITRLW